MVSPLISTSQRNRTGCPSSQIRSFLLLYFRGDLPLLYSRLTPSTRVTHKIISGTYSAKSHWKNKCSKERPCRDLKCPWPGRLQAIDDCPVSPPTFWSL